MRWKIHHTTQKLQIRAQKHPPDCHGMSIQRPLFHSDYSAINALTAHGSALHFTDIVCFTEVRAIRPSKGAISETIRSCTYGGFYPPVRRLFREKRKTAQSARASPNNQPETYSGEPVFLFIWPTSQILKAWTHSAWSSMLHLGRAYYRKDNSGVLLYSVRGECLQEFNPAQITTFLSQN